MYLIGVTWGNFSLTYSFYVINDHGLNSNLARTGRYVDFVALFKLNLEFICTHL